MDLEDLILKIEYNRINGSWTNTRENATDIIAYLYELLELRKTKDRQEILIVSQELNRAMSIHKPMNSAHEGYAVIKEELEELWDEIKKKECERNIEHMKEEAIQLSAMGLRFIIDVCGGIKK